MSEREKPDHAYVDPWQGCAHTRGHKRCGRPTYDHAAPAPKVEEREEPEEDRLRAVIHHMTLELESFGRHEPECNCARDVTPHAADCKDCECGLASALAFGVEQSGMPLEPPDMTPEEEARLHARGVAIVNELLGSLPTPAPPEGEAKAVKIERSPEWWLERARAEGDATIGAGALPPPSEERRIGGRTREEWVAALNRNSDYRPNPARIGVLFDALLSAAFSSGEGASMWDDPAIAFRHAAYSALDGKIREGFTIEQELLARYEEATAEGEPRSCCRAVAEEVRAKVLAAFAEHDGHNSDDCLAQIRADVDALPLPTSETPL